MNEFDMAEIGKRISSLRKRNGLTQIELADKLLVSFQAVSHWERGQTMPDISKLAKLSEVFSVTIDELLENSKSSEIVNSIISNTDMPKVTADELIEVAPILTSEQVDDLVSSVSSEFTSEQAEQIIPPMSFEGDYDCSNDELAENIYKKNDIAFFSNIVDTLTQEQKQHFFNKAYEDGRIDFFAVLLQNSDLTNEQRSNFLNKSYEDGRIDFFAVLLRNSDLTNEQRNYFLNKSCEDDKIEFFAVLSDKGFDSKFNGFDSKFKGFDSNFKGFDSNFKGFKDAFKIFQKF